MNPEKILKEKVALALKDLYGAEFPDNQIVFQKTRPEFGGQFTLVTFPFIKTSKKSPELTGEEIGKWMMEKGEVVSAFNVIKGFLNFSLGNAFWLQYFDEVLHNESFGSKAADSESKSIMIEYPSPNTNKPLHLGHLRNIFLGSSVAEILKANGNKVIHTCLYNDRGTNISKSMLAWKLFGNGETPESSGKKGDHLVGEYYVKFSEAYKNEIGELISSGLSKEDAEKKSMLTQQVNEMTIAWEKGDKEVRELWKMMNSWVYEGFEETYSLLGIQPEKFYYESDVYDLGKETVQEGLEKGIFYKKDDGSVWIDLTADGLDHKLVLRSNGTSVYITQDIATANEKERDYKIDQSIYVVGNEQDYHFKVLFLILKKLGRTYADNLFHLSYGMVELPSGKMKSREGTVVDADDLVEEVMDKAEAATKELGKIEGFSEEEAKTLYKTIGLGALKYFILKVDPKKKMLFNPAESVDMNGNTGPFIQYTHARIRSLVRKSEKNEQWFLSLDLKNSSVAVNAEEIELLRMMHEFPWIIAEAGSTYNPALVANFVYELAKKYNRFFHDHSVLNEPDKTISDYRLALSWKTGLVIKKAMKLLGIDVPERM
jgi:arginyl-tRNA synthetase